MDSWAAFCSGLGGMILGAGIIMAWLQQLLRDYAHLKRRVEEHLEVRLDRLEEEGGASEKVLVDHRRRLLTLEDRVADLNEPLLRQRVDSLARQIDRLEGQITRCLEATARQEEQLRNLLRHSS